MKHLFITLIAFLTLVACGGKGSNSVEDVIAAGDLEAIKVKRTQVNDSAKMLASQIKALDDAIAQLDTTDIATLITTQTISDTLFKHFVEIQGNVTTDQNVIVYPEYQGTLTKVYVSDGQKVRKGQLLGRIDDGGLSSQLSQLESQMALAKTTYERQSRLWEQKIGSEIQYLQAKTTYESSQDAVNQLKRQLAKTTVVAPFSGIVDEVITDQGTVVAPGQGLFRVVNLDQMYIEAQVPERYLASIEKGSEVEIFLPVLGKTVSSKVRQTGNYINPGNRTFNIEVGVPLEANAKPNLTARLKINDYTSEKAILIPMSVVSEDADGQQYVYKMVSDADNSGFVANRTNVTLGKTQGDVVEILEGLSNEDALVVEGARSVQDGQEVRTLENN